LADPIQAFFDIGVEEIFGFMANGRAHRGERIVTGSPWSKAIAVGGQTRFSFRFKHVFSHLLAGSIRHRGDSQGPVVRRARFWYPGASDGAGRPIEGARLGYPQALLGHQGFHAVNPCRLFPAIVLGDPPGGEELG
jgi:hypothetical protein